MFAIVCDEIGKQFFEFWRRTRTPFGFESAGNHGLGAAANQIPRSVVVQRRQTLPCQNDAETEKLEAITSTGEPPRPRPNPVVVEFSPASPSTAKKPAKPAAKKPATLPKAAAAPAPAPMTAAPTQAPSSPWPTYPPVVTPIRSPCPFGRRGLRGRSQNSGRYRQYQPEFLYMGCEPWDSGPGNG